MIKLLVIGIRAAGAVFPSRHHDTITHGTGLDCSMTIWISILHTMRNRIHITNIVHNWDLSWFWFNRTRQVRTALGRIQSRSRMILAPLLSLLCRIEHTVRRVNCFAYGGDGKHTRHRQRIWKVWGPSINTTFCTSEFSWKLSIIQIDVIEIQTPTEFLQSIFIGQHIIKRRIREHRRRVCILGWRQRGWIRWRNPRSRTSLGRESVYYRGHAVRRKCRPTATRRGLLHVPLWRVSRSTIARFPAMAIVFGSRVLIFTGLPFAFSFRPAICICFCSCTTSLIRTRWRDFWSCWRCSHRKMCDDWFSVLQLSAWWRSRTIMWWLLLIWWRSRCWCCFGWIAS